MFYIPWTSRVESVYLMYDCIAVKGFVNSKHIHLRTFLHPSAARLSLVVSVLPPHAWRHRGNERLAQNHRTYKGDASDVLFHMLFASSHYGSENPSASR